jgi:drug/metabolite transporter (DMT)-like permease
VNGTSERAGLLFAAYCVVNSAFVPAVAKLTTVDASGVAIALWTSVFAGIGGLAMLAWHGELRLLVARKTAPVLVTVGALGTALAFVLFFEGAKRASAIDTAVCVQTEPLYALLGARVFLGHALTLRRVCAVGAILVGIALALGARPLEGSLGVALLLATPLAWQSSHWIALRGLDGVNPRLLSAARYVYGAGVLLPIWLWVDGVDSVPPSEEFAQLLPVVALQGVLISYGGTLAWYASIKRLDLARTTAIVVPSAPLLSLVVSYLVLDEVVNVRQMVGFVVTAAGVLIFALAPNAAAEVGESYRGD